MDPKPKHIVLLGFKHVGKSTVGKLLAEKLEWPFIDLDKLIEINYQKEYQPIFSCREIFQKHGELFFRNIETQALCQAIALPTAIIALGGGTPLPIENQALIKSYLLIHLTANPKIVYERMMAHGKPAFFPDEQDPIVFFQQLWHQRGSVYANLANLTVDNTQPAPETVAFILKKLETTR